MNNSMLGRRSREEDPSEHRTPTRARMTVPRTIISTFELELNKMKLAYNQAVGICLRRQIGDREPVLDPTGGPPSFAFWGTVVEGLRNVVEAERRFGGPKCAILQAFGDNDLFTQGLPDLVDKEEQQTDNFVPHPLGVPVPHFRQVAAGGTSVGGLTWDGKVYTWGSPDDGALGRVKLDPTQDDGRFSATPAEVTKFVTSDGINARGTITEIAFGAIHIIYLSAEHGVFISGAFKDSDSGIFSPPDPAFKPAGRAPPEPKAELREKTLPDGKKEMEVIPLGYNQPDTYGIVGSNQEPVHIPELKDIIRVYSGGNFCAALDADRQLWTFGFGSSGELARSSTMAAPDAEGKYDLGTNFYRNKKSPTHGWFHMDKLRDLFLRPGRVHFDVSGKVRVLNVACGDIHMLVTGVNDQGKISLYSAGHNNYGQLGHGDRESRHALTPVEFFDQANHIVGQVAAGNHHSLALTAGGDALFAFGRADYGQLGRGPTKGGAFEVTPQRVPIPLGTILREVFAGESASGATTADGELFTWGYEGVTGHGGRYLNEDCNYPRKMQLSGISRYHSIAMGSQFGLILADDQAPESSMDELPKEPVTKRRRLEGK